MPTRLILALLLMFTAALVPARGQTSRHPGLFTTPEEAASIRESLGNYPLLDAALDEAKVTVAAAFAAPMDVPLPGEAGGYAHERHKQNYREMMDAGLLFTITGDERYATFVRDMLRLYADLYPTLGAHPLAHNQAAGKLFHQTLNEEVWLVHAAVAYDAVYDWLTPEDRALFEKNIFRPMADWFSVRNENEFNRIHNHGTWAVAAVGMIGYVMGDQEYVDKALYGSKKDGNGGFLAQLDRLFSPDGYYMEGPYYIRYALMPFFFFAEAIERKQPEIGIYAYRDQILRKALYSALQTTFPNGVFPPINDASRTMNVAAPEVVLATDLAYARYGADESLLGVADRQRRVVLNGAGLQVARDLAALDHAPGMNWKSVEFTDGYEGLQGGLGILRAGDDASQTMLLMKYGVHGEGHGHFDKLQFILFDGGREVVPDYGYARWINVEPKFGGRYLPENDSYAMQTVAHNTVVVDEKTQNDFDLDAADAVSGKRHFFDGKGERVQAMSARADDHYEGVEMQRTMFLIDDERLDHPAVLDLFRLTSGETHQYDYPLHFRGQFVASSVPYEAHTETLERLGTRSGYEHLWNEAEARTDEPLRMTWLDGNRYYSFITAAAPDTKVILARTGAGDANFNLISEPLLILRRKAQDHLFASVIEPHGYWNEAEESSRRATGVIETVRVIGHSDEASVVEVTGQGGLRWTVMVANGTPSTSAAHSVSFAGKNYTWTGNYSVQISE